MKQQDQPRPRLVALRKRRRLYGLCNVPSKGL